jgi:hypothetical protein
VFSCRPWLGRVFDGGTDALAEGDCWVGVVAVTLVEESVLLAFRRYLPGEGFTGASGRDNERSGTDVERFIEAGRLSMTDFLKSPSSRAANDGAASERLEEPEVETVESDDEDGWVGWPKRVGFAACCCCGRPCCCCADIDRVSCRS